MEPKPPKTGPSRRENFREPEKPKVVYVLRGATEAERFNSLAIRERVNGVLERLGGQLTETEMKDIGYLRDIVTLVPTEVPNEESAGKTPPEPKQ